MGKMILLVMSQKVDAYEIWELSPRTRNNTVFSGENEMHRFFFIQEHEQRSKHDAITEL